MITHIPANDKGYVGFTRLQIGEKTFCSLGIWTRKQMLEAIRDRPNG